MTHGGVVGFAVLLAAARLLGQGIPLATLVGKVTTEDGTGLGAIRVRAESPALQGTRETSTSDTGDYVLNFLPAGEYRIRFEMAGLAPAERNVVLVAGVAVRLDQIVRPSGVAESVQVTGEASPTVPAGSEIVTAFRKREIDRLPNGRTIRDIVLLAPGVTGNGPRGFDLLQSNPQPGLMISGAMSYESLFLVNGVVVNDNIRGQPHDVFIEDAIAETTVDTGRISAEYGRFTGGVVNVVTRSGGNRWSGSFRVSLSSDRWTANDPYNRPLDVDNRVDRVNSTYEATFGFPVLRDRLWGFAAARYNESVDSRQTSALELPGDSEVRATPYEFNHRDERLEGKLTGAVTGSHNLVASYMREQIEEKNWSIFGPRIFSPDSTIDRSNPNSLLALNYNGVLSASAFLEAQYSQRRFTLEQLGSRSADWITGTLLGDVLRDITYGAAAAGGQPPLHYDNDSWYVKASYLLSSSRLGSHELRAGYEMFRESSFHEFDFTPSGFIVNESSSIVRGNEIFPTFRPDETTQVSWFPIVAPPGWTRLVTHSAFVNDRFHAGRHWSGNIGVRYDWNHDRSADGALVSTDENWSPRLALQFDWSGDGRVLIDGGYARYVAKAHDNLVNFGSAAGSPAFVRWIYDGPCVNCDPFAPTEDLLSIREALGVLFGWFDAGGGTARAPIEGSYPGFSRRLDTRGLRSPTATEYSIGTSIALGARGAVRLDFLDRRFHNLYSGRIDLSTGKSADPLGNVFDVEVIGNSNRLRRRYVAVQARADYRAPLIAAGLAYTWSRLTGNSVGEIDGFFVADFGHNEEYPEYREARWNHPIGAQPSDNGLSPDQRHRARAWVVWEAVTPVGRVSIGAIESLDSGRGYEAVGPVASEPYVANPGYAYPPEEVAYYFTKPGAFRTETVTSTDLSLTWSVPLHRSLEVFVHAQLFNVFNESALVDVDKTVETSRTDNETLANFDPFDEQPRLGVNWRYGPAFGEPRGPEDYQRPRTFEFSVGLRF